jgi:hypothetical protein
MSMIGVLVRVTKDQLKAFREDSSLFETYVDDEEIFKSERYLDIDKSWEAMLYLLTGHTIATLDELTPPLGLFFFSNQLLDEEQDMGYGPAHYLNPDQVKTVHQALSNISESDFISKYDAGQLNENNVYHESWENGEDDKEYLTTHFQQLKKFYSSAAREQEAIITYVT